MLVRSGTGQYGVPYKKDKKDLWPISATCVNAVVGDGAAAADKITAPTDALLLAQLPPLRMKRFPAEKAP